MDLTEQFLESQTIFEGRILNVKVDKVRLPNGNTSTREWIKHRGAVAVVPVTEDKKLILVRQFRYPLGRVTLEIPAGKLDTVEEDRLDAAKRELHEEVGVVAASWRNLGEFHPSPAILNERITLYLAQEFTYNQPCPDDDEFLEIEAMPLDKLVDMVLAGEISDAKTQTAILKVYALDQKGLL
jgi:ADP-ribose pyrophosphatase